MQQKERKEKEREKEGKVFSLSITIADSRVSTISGKQLLYSHYCFAGVTISGVINSAEQF